LLPDGKIGSVAARAYYEVCSSPKVFELAEYLTATANASAPPRLRRITIRRTFRPFFIARTSAKRKRASPNALAQVL